MTLATRIKMKPNCYASQKLEEIDSIFLTGDFNGWFKKEAIHDYIKKYNGIIRVNIYPKPRLIAVTTPKERYVRSEANTSYFDNLLELPRV